MDFKEFSKQALRTESIPTQLNVNPGLLAATLSLGVETANLVDLVKKSLAYGKLVDQEKAINIANTIRGLAQVLEDLMPYINETDPSFDIGINKVNTDGNSLGPYTAADFPLRLTHAFIGSFTETGELLAALMDAARDGVSVDRVNIGEEYGDGDWYKAIAFEELGITEVDSRQAVLDKLARRYKTGIFTAEQALNRDVATERTALEGSL